MSPVRILGIALLIAGIIALYFGWQASEAFVDPAHEAMTGRFPDESMWYFIGGGVAVVVGLLLTLFGVRRSGMRVRAGSVLSPPAEPRGRVRTTGYR